VKRTQRILMSMVLLGAALLPLNGRGREQKPLAFEAASIKPNGPDASGQIRVAIMPQPGGRLTIVNANLRILIQFAYNIDDAQISGGPAFMDSDRYDIVAKGDSNATTDELRQMLQSLLDERFKLKVRYDTKELPVFALVSGKGGSKLKEVKDNSSVPVSEDPSRSIRITAGAVVAIAGSMSMDELSQSLATMLGRRVLNKTGLEGTYDVKLEFTPQPGELSIIRGPGAGAAAPADLNGVGLFTAIQEQLGLKLDSQKGPVDVLVIDSAAKPTEN
jgi:uncharacterized protein (TIGR03435 family)